MRICICSDQSQIARVGANQFSEVMKENSKAVLGLATGSTPLPIYQELISRYKAGEISFAGAQAFCLDEYLGLPAGHPESYSSFIRREFTAQVDFDDTTVHLPAGQSPEGTFVAEEYDSQIAAAGGVDLQILGVGANGHIGFNEPGGSLDSKTHVGILAQKTREDNARFFDGDISQVPDKCVTQGLGTILKARKVLLVATGKQKAEAVAALVEGAVTSMWPASVLQAHNDALILVDEDAASLLKNKDRYTNSLVSPDDL